MRRNTSGQKWRVFAFDATTNQEVTGDAANITAKISKDWGAATALGDVNPTETEDGYYLFDLTAAETNAHELAIYPESSTLNVQVVGVPGAYVTEEDTITIAPAVVGSFPCVLLGPSLSYGSDEDVTAIVGSKIIIRFIRNDAYDGVANAVKRFTVTKNYTGWTGVLTVRHRATNVSLLSKAVSVYSGVELRCSLTSAETAFAACTTDHDFGPHPFDIEMVSGSSKQTAVRGIAIVLKDQTTA